MPSKVEGICDKCGSELIKRKDDEPETIKARLVTYHNETEPVIEYFREEGLLETIPIDIYSPTTREDTTLESFKRIRNRNNKE
jgi:adenylate kinase family enzyme